MRNWLRYRWLFEGCGPGAGGARGGGILAGRVWLGATRGLFAVLVGTLAADRLEASCGDWLQHAPQAAVGNAMAAESVPPEGRQMLPAAFALDAWWSRDALPGGVGDDFRPVGRFSEGSQPAPRPCHGAQCGQLPVSPLPPLAAREVSGERPVAVAMVSGVAGGFCHRPGLAELQDDYPLPGFPFAIKRPPRI